METFTEHDLVVRLKEMVACPHGSKKALAEKLGISPIYLFDLLSGRRPITKRIAEILGFKMHKEITVTYIPLDDIA